MKKRYFNYILLAMAVATVTGCKKNFLTRPPEDSIVADVFYKTTDELRAGTAPLYNIVWFDYNDKAALSFGDARAGNMISNDRDMFYKFAVTATDVNTLLPAYKSFYKIVAQSNQTIRNIQNNAISVKDSIKNAGIGECRFMRALAYYYLVSNWGAVPIIYDNLAQMSDVNVRRNTVESIWQLIIMDLKFAADNLPAVAFADGRLTKYAAEGMLARMYLTRAGVGKSGGTRNQSDLDSAKYYAADVINNGPYELQSNYADLFKSENHNSSKNNKESLFSIQWMPIKDPWGVNNSFQAYMARNGDITGSWDGWGAAHGASANLIEYYLDNPADSIRRKATFMFNNDFYPEIRKDLGGYKFTATDIANTKKYIIGSVKDNGGKGSEMCEYINTYMLRLAEVYLIYAEAILGNNGSTSDAEALKYYNAVRTRVNLPAKTSITFDDIFLEKRIETVFEGIYWYELMRLYYFNPAKAQSIINNQNKGSYTLTHKTGTENPREYTVTYDPVKYPVTNSTMYLPLPEAELVKAPNLAAEPVAFDFSLLK
ncbi:RagB/SusD family nutrient uptake outer membrane protein [Niastella caeni]|uniref:RagB/SusD family nutrient uptake outer membrane protein n=1 Tax=Niastella caeni TaxID=2569763 RepID=A0A4S8HWZ4_9BACT|nr:RagB/SusD family nutrient uptake outer membrane protein [Niastella caeni]THU40223.1 RagB/SusD family nutrient uptake outer membrane protein [Niastella caeni]